MTLTVRVIPMLLLSSHPHRLTKTVNFQDRTEGLRRDVGDLVKQSMVYEAQLADELIVVDHRASLEGRGIERIKEAVSLLAGKVFMPVTAGGGIRSVKDIRDLLTSGADKVVIGTQAAINLELIVQSAHEFGSQCISIAIDVRQGKVSTHSGRVPICLSPEEWAITVCGLGAGEILLNSADRDGTMRGYDLEMVRGVSSAVEVPVIVSGGAECARDLVEAVKAGASGVVASSLWEFSDISPIKAKAYMEREGIGVRR